WARVRIVTRCVADTHSPARASGHTSERRERVLDAAAQGFPLREPDAPSRGLARSSGAARWTGSSRGGAMQKIRLIIVTLVAAAAPLHGQTLSFQQTFGGAGFDRGEGVAVAPDGSIYVVGETNSFSAGGDEDILLLKYAPDGTLLLQKTYGTSGPVNSEFGNGIAVAPDGSVYVCGDSADSKALLAKFDASLNLIWQRTWGGTLGETALGVAVSGDGASAYITGQTLSFGAGNIDAFLVKFDAAGNLVWQRTWGCPVNENGQAVTVAADGSIYMAGDGNSFFGNDAILVKFSPAGAVLWDRDWRGGTGQNDESAALGVRTASDGSVYMTGRA